MDNTSLIKNLKEVEAKLDAAIKSADFMDKGDWFKVAEASGTLQALIILSKNDPS